MKTRDFSFDLPEHLIAQQPPAERGHSRLLVADPVQKTVVHSRFAQILDFIEPDTLLVFNNSKVRKARTFAQTATGGRVEVLFLTPRADNVWECLINKSKKQRAGGQLFFPEGITAVFLEGEGNVRHLRFSRQVTDDELDRWGHIPIPPYIKRSDTAFDAQRYQNIYAETIGSSAAPTAGLHFTQETLDQLRAKGVETAFVTLHVGLGTFLPVRVENVTEHQMHREAYSIDAENAAKINAAKAAGKKILAVGTTSVRTLESAWQNGQIQAGASDTAIFIYPGYRFKVVDQLITNFHTPESTLLMLVSAFAGWDFVKAVYAQAVAENYRFFSYGDCTFFRSRIDPT